MPLPTQLPAGVVATVQPGSNGKPTTVLKFDNAKIQASIDSALKSIPEGEKGAIVGFGNLEGAQLVFAYKKGHWTYVVQGSIDWATMDLSAEAAVRFSWGKE